MQQPLAVRVAELERQMMSLRDLPDRVSALEARVGSLDEQIVQLRSDMKAEFSAIREDIKAGDTETRRYMRILHEEVIERIQTIGGG